MELMYATGNPAKQQAMARRLAPLGITLVFPDTHPHIEESGTTMLENAMIKAKAYWNIYHRPLFSCDTGLFFRECTEDEQPGVFVHRNKGRELSDEQIGQRFAMLSRKYNGLTAQYRNAVCLILDENHIHASEDPSLWSMLFRVTDTPHRMKKPGFPIDSYSVDMETGQYFYDTDPLVFDRIAVADGFLDFFERSLAL
ncbi:MAG: hypothetical protein IKD69_05250 [Solobacterium sp.]|nr:hypothetical protein [Solobacterium sp.]